MVSAERCPHCGVHIAQTVHLRDCPERVRIERAKQRARELFFGKET